MKRHYSILLFILMSILSCSGQQSHQNPVIRDSNVVVAINTLSQGIPVFYTYSYQGRKINFIVIKINDRVLSFLDACENCHTARRGYRYEEGYLICRLCNVKYPVSGIEKGLGSCSPIPLAGRVQDGQYLIHLSALEKMVNMF